MATSNEGYLDQMPGKSTGRHMSNCSMRSRRPATSRSVASTAYRTNAVRKWVRFYERQMEREEAEAAAAEA